MGLQAAVSVKGAAQTSTQTHTRGVQRFKGHSQLFKSGLLVLLSVCLGAVR